jgi:hypothetical protein
MNAKVSLLVIAMIVVATSITLATSTAGATSKQLGSCNPTTVDIICLVNPSLKITPKPGAISSSTARRVAAGSNVTTSTRGVADLYFRHRALCRMMAPTPRGTSLRTRYPFTSFLFTQHRGETICTLPDLTVIGVTGSGSLQFAQGALRRGTSTHRQLSGLLSAPFKPYS